VITGVFQKVIDDAPTYGIRAIAINRRGYKDSSPFTSEELTSLEAETCTLEERRRFMTGQALELADFIKHLVDRNMVSPQDGNQGGVAILGWSLGNAYVFDFLSHVTTLPDHELSALVKQYLREYIVFGKSCHQSFYHIRFEVNHLDPPLDVFGLPPPFSKHVSKKEELSRISDPQEAANMWNDYISGWYESPPVPSHLSADLSTWSDEDKESRYGSPYDKPIGKSTRVIEGESGSAAFQECNEPSAMRADVAIVLKPALRGELRPVTEAVLFEDPQKTLWPGMRIEYAYCANSVTSCVYAGEATRFRFEKAVPGRRMTVIAHANHFVSSSFLHSHTFSQSLSSAPMGRSHALS
jgi:hypothetical protein